MSVCSMRTSEIIGCVQECGNLTVKKGLCIPSASRINPISVLKENWWNGKAYRSC